MTTMARSEIFYVVTDKLVEVIEEAVVPKAQIARDGKLSKETLAKAIKGKRITRAKANGILKGLKENHSEMNLSFEDAFKEA